MNNTGQYMLFVTNIKVILTILLLLLHQLFHKNIFFVILVGGIVIYNLQPKHKYIWTSFLIFIRSAIISRKLKSK